MFLKAMDSCWTLQRRAPTTLQASVHCCLVSELTAIRVTSAFLWLVQYIKQRIESDTLIDGRATPCLHQLVAACAAHSHTDCAIT